MAIDAAGTVTRVHVCMYVAARRSSVWLWAEKEERPRNEEREPYDCPVVVTYLSCATCVAFLVIFVVSSSSNHDMEDGLLAPWGSQPLTKR